MRPGRHVGGADGAEQQGVEAPPLLDGLVGEDDAVAQVPTAAEVVVDAVELDARGAHDLQRLGDDLVADPVAGDDTDLVTHVRSVWLGPGPEGRTGRCTGCPDGPVRVKSVLPEEQCPEKRGAAHLGGRPTSAHRARRALPNDRYLRGGGVHRAKV